MTVGDVIEQFAACELRTGKTVSHMLWRTVDFWTGRPNCPLQVVTGFNTGYMSKARRLGLTDPEINAIMSWADYGNWPIDEFCRPWNDDPREVA